MAEPSTQATSPKKDVLLQLIDQGLVSEDDAEQARRRHRRGRISIQQALLDLGTVSEEAIYRAVAIGEGLPFVTLYDRSIDDEVIGKVPVKVALRYHLLPISFENGTITAAFSDPPAMRDLQALRLLLGIRVQPVVATHADVGRTIKQYYGVGAQTVMQLRQDRGFQDSKDNVHVDAPAEELAVPQDDASVAQLFNQFLREAIEVEATDIHIEPFEEHVRVRYRIDGVLREIPTPTGMQQLHSAIISRAKVMANLNIAEHRLPHDGRIRVNVEDDQFDLRVSILPTRFGETLNMRLLNRQSIFLSLEDLGLEDSFMRILLKMLELPHGMILVTGPTGSGKSTTLYASLDKTDKVQRKVITVEDPVEYQMEGISQIQIRSSIGLTFAAALRSILRHDPDIILVGEIRDPETAEIAIRSALTGHLVLSTLHTNDSVGAVNRLVDMDVEPFLVASSLSSSIAQRLVRRICPNCKEEVPQDDIPLRLRDEISRVMGCADDEVQAWRGKGCVECRSTGYRGRVAIYEFFLMSEELEDMVARRATTAELRDHAIKEGMEVLRQDGWRKVSQGQTTIDEVLRITTSFDIRYDM